MQAKSVTEELTHSKDTRYCYEHIVTANEHKQLLKKYSDVKCRLR